LAVPAQRKPLCGGPASKKRLRDSKTAGQVATVLDALRFAVVTDNYPPYVGGGPLTQWELARGLARRGHQVEVVTSRLAGTAKEEWEDGVHVVRTGRPGRGGRYRFCATGLPAVRRAAKRADALQACMFTGAVPGSLGARAARCPSLLTVYEVFADDWRTYVPRRALAAALQAAERALVRLPFDAHVAHSHYTARRLRALSGGRLEPQVVYPGIDQTFWRPDPTARGRFRAANGLGERFTYLFYGRAGISKGIRPLLDAAEAFAAQRPQARMVMVLSPGELEAATVERIRSSPVLRQHVVLHRSLPRPELRDAVLGSDCVVVPSLAEGFGFTAAEPCHAGVPVLAARAGALPEVVGGRHLLVPPADPAALVQGLLRAEAGDWDNAPRKEFSWDDYTLGYERLLRQVAAGA